MSRGTWQGSGTWQSGGPDLGDIGLIFAVCAAAGVVVEVVLSIIVWIAVALGIASALAVVGLVWWVRGKPAREARFTAALAAQRQAHAVTATVTPQVTQETRPAIVNNYYITIDPASREAAGIIRQALPGPAGDITEGK